MVAATRAALLGVAFAGVADAQVQVLRDEPQGGWMDAFMTPAPTPEPEPTPAPVLGGLPNCVGTLGAEDFQFRRVGDSRFNFSVFTPPDRQDTTLKHWYTSTRFDWSSMIGNVCIGQYVVFPDNLWLGPHDPAGVDAGMGFSDEFGCNESGAKCDDPGLNDMPESDNGILGWEDDSEEFIKIGVGILMKIQGESEYDPARSYTVSENNPFWRVTAASTFVTMQHSVSLGQYGYDLQKTVEVGGTVARPSIVITTTFANTGNGTTIRTPHYAHNFLNDKGAIDTNWFVLFNETDVTMLESDNQEGFQLSMVPAQDGAQKIDVVRPLTESIKTWFIGPNNSGALDEWTVQIKDSNLTIHSESVNHNKSLYKYLFYSSQNTFSPAPMQMIDLPANQSMVWSRTVTFTLPGLVAADQPWVPSVSVFLTIVTIIGVSLCVGSQIQSYAKQKMDKVSDTFKPNLLSDEQEDPPRQLTVRDESTTLIT